MVEDLKSPPVSEDKLEDEPLILPEEDDADESGKISEKGDKEQLDDSDDEDVGEEVAKKDEELTFTPTQQAKINEIVKTRLERAEIKWQRDLMNASGTEVDTGETFDAMRLWGFLKLNPDISIKVEETMAEFVKKGNYRQPEYKQSVSKERLLEVKEEIINLREKDGTFAKHSTDVMEWADSRGFAITDKDSLHLAYLAWKGERGNVVRATEQLREQRKQAKKTELKKKAKLAGGKSSTEKKPVKDYRKLSDKEVLEAEGLSLFTDD